MLNSVVVNWSCYISSGLEANEMHAALQALEKETGWRHAVITVETQKAKTAMMRQLADCQIQGTRLKCTEIVARDTAETVVAAQKNSDPPVQATKAGSKRIAELACTSVDAPKAKQPRVEQPKQVHALLCWPPTHHKTSPSLSLHNNSTVFAQ
jgi:pyrimidine deaminase RibD-like protein